MQSLKITCPSCQYQFDLLSGLQDAEQRAYWSMISKSGLSSDQISLLFRYLTMFKPAKNAMSFKTLNARTSELLEFLDSGRVSRNGNTRVATPKAWWAAIEQLVTNKPDSLQLPIRNHAYLEQMVFNHAEAALAKQETQQIEEQRNRSRAEAEGRAGLASINTLLKKTKPQSGDHDAS